MKNIKISHLSIASWNVQGLKAKLNDPCFITEVKKHHIIALVETHYDDNTQLALEGYCVYQVNRAKSGHKAHGGIAIFVKKELRPGIKFYPAQSNDLLWVCLKKEFFNTLAHVFIGAVYISPANSSYTKKLDYDPFDIIESEIEKYTGQGQIILMGDFNARTSITQDFILDDGIQHDTLPQDFIYDTDCSCRYSQDVKIVQCKYGRQLIDLSIASGLKILNGRTMGDSYGKYTCHSYNGSTVIDYVLADGVTLPQIRYFKVDELIGDISDHCKISFGMAVSVLIMDSNVKQCPKRSVTKYRWCKESESKFQLHLGSKQSRVLLEEIFKTDILDIDSSIDSLTKCINDAASKCLKKISCGKQRTNKWFTPSCATLRTEVKRLGKALCQNPKNSDTRYAFYHTKKQYRKAVKHSKTSFKQSLALKLQDASISNPKDYWQILEQLKRVDSCGDKVSCPIESEEWVKHFSNLYKPHASSSSAQEADVLSELEMLERDKVFNELSYKITVDEISNATKTLN